MIAERTRAALTVRKAQGVALGNRTNLATAHARDTARMLEEAARFAANVAPIIREIQTNGITSLRSVAVALNAQGVKAARGSRWQSVQVGAILARVAAGACA
jgi:DNA invertase Pin-like site-specific DNA recombinase